MRKIAPLALLVCLSASSASAQTISPACRAAVTPLRDEAVALARQIGSVLDLNGYDRDGRINRILDTIRQSPEYQAVRGATAAYYVLRASGTVSQEQLASLWASVSNAYEELKKVLPARDSVYCAEGLRGEIRRSAVTVGGETVTGPVAVCVSATDGSLSDYAVDVLAASVDSTYLPPGYPGVNSAGEGFALSFVVEIQPSVFLSRPYVIDVHLGDELDVPHYPLPRAVPVRGLGISLHAMVNDGWCMGAYSDFSQIHSGSTAFGLDGIAREVLGILLGCQSAIGGACTQSEVRLMTQGSEFISL